MSTARLLTLLLLPLALAAGCIDPAAGPATGLRIWAQSAEDELGAATPPRLENELYSAQRGELRLAAALNETVAFQLGLHTGAPPAGPFHVELSDLKSSTGDSLRVADVTAVFRVHYARVERFRSWYTVHTGRPAIPTLVPDIAVPWSAPRGGGPLTLSETRNEIIWVDLHVPPTAAPGEYTGQVILRDAAGATAFSCTLRLEIVPIALPGRRNLPVVCRVDPRDLLTAHLRWPREQAEHTRLLRDVPTHFAGVHIVDETMRLLHGHRATPVLWASFPKYQPVGDRTLAVDWTEYDHLVSGWLDGSAFPDGDPLDVWPLPASLNYPDAELNGGLDSPEYGRLLATYLAECARHFEERGWRQRAFVRLGPPEPLTQAAVDRVRRLGTILRQSEINVPLVAHLPAASLRGLGWQNAPSIALPEVGVWAPPAMWYEPEVMTAERKLGRRTWLMPDIPPYSGSLAIEAPLLDSWALPWIAYRYGVDALWIENAAEFALTPAAAAQFPWNAAGLLYPADDFGLREHGPVASLRLKRLRRGLQDYELLKLLEANGQAVLAQRVAEQVVRWAATEASLDNLLDTREAGWPSQPAVLRLARNLILRELTSQFTPTAITRQQQIASLSEWSLMFNQADRITVAVDGVRLTALQAGLNARVFGSVSNASNRPIAGRWLLPSPPPEWQQLAEAAVTVPPAGRRTTALDVFVPGLAYNVDGIYPFDVSFDTAEVGSFPRVGRLAIAACLRPQRVPVIDGLLDDWPLASNNAAGDFRLTRGPALGEDEPAQQTRAFFCLDEQHLYVGVRAALRAGEPPIWQADNAIPIDGTIPWGQDVLEVLLDPRPTAEGTSSDLYCLQIKPSGLLLARKGCRTEPPIGASEPWPSGTRGAAKVDRDFWSVELAIPLESFGPQARRNALWGVNVTRLDARRGEYSSWSGARGYCYSPRALGNLLMLWER